MYARLCSSRRCSWMALFTRSREVWRPGVACEEGEAGLPCGAFCAQALEIFYRLPAQLLARGRVEGDCDGIFDLEGT
jgi:hypothetical protein